MLKKLFWNPSTIFHVSSKWKILYRLYIYYLLLYTTIAIHKFPGGGKNRREEIEGVIIDIESYLFEFWRRKGRVSIDPRYPYRISSAPSEEFKRISIGYRWYSRRRREFVNFYRAIETFALSRHSNSCGNLSLNICWGTVPPSSPSSSPSCFLNVSPSSHPSFLLHELHFPSFFNSWRIKFFPLCLVANSKSNTPNNCY